MNESLSWVKAAGALKLLALGLVLVMFAKMGWELAQGRKADPSPFHWLVILVLAIHWAIRRRRSSDAP